MIRVLYRWLISLHPPRFRDRFGDEMVCIFDDTEGDSKAALLADILISVLRQRVLRSGSWRLAIVLPGALTQMMLGALVWFAVVGRARVIGPFPIDPVLSELETSPDIGGLLLVLSGIVTAILMSVTILGVWMGGFCRSRNRRGLASNRSRPHPGLAIILTLGVAGATCVNAQSTVQRPAFEVASVKLSATDCSGGRGGGAGAPVPGMLKVQCMPVRDLIQAAYGTYAAGRPVNQQLPELAGAPRWVEADPYDITGKPAGMATVEQMYGPMLQVLLEERFRLKVHRETKDALVYSLTVAPGGSKLRATPEGSCTVFDPSRPPTRTAGERSPNLCGRGSMKTRNGNIIVDGFGMTMASFAGTTLSARPNLDRPVLDRTGIAGLFDIHLEFAHDRPGGADADSEPGASLFTALQEQLGLKLSRDKGPVDVLIVDHIERPSGN